MGFKHALTAAALLATAGSAQAHKNMNGMYLVSESTTRKDAPKPFSSDYASKGYEYFDVYAPEIATHYGEVFWTDQHNQALPEAIVKRFANKTIAIVGYEQDQVMVTPQGQPGVNPEQDVSVPINWAYNHHYMTWMTGSYSELRRVPADPFDTSAHGAPTKWKLFDLPTAALRSDPSIPTSQLFSEGNGGESRKSFHGYPKGYAQLVEGPNLWHITPMQIDTRNRDCGVHPDNVTNSKCGRGFVPGPEPKQARWGRGIPANTTHSGVLECPCNGRYGGDPAFYGTSTTTKTISHVFMTTLSPRCNQAVATAEGCFEAVAGFGLADGKLPVTNNTVHEKTLPPGCSYSVSATSGVSAYFNGHGTVDSVKCGAPTQLTGVRTSPVGVTLNVTLDTVKGLATIEASGPAGGWFGVGLNATRMSDKPYTLVFNSSGVHERHLGTCGSEACHCAGNVLETTATVISNTVDQASQRRTVTITRPLQGKTDEHYTFDPVSNGATLNFISAIGSSQVFAYHKAHAPSQVSLSAVDGSALCVCDEASEGKLCTNNGTECGAWQFPGGCVTGPNASLANQHNPTCSSMTYSGGLKCCHHARIMLDADQEIRPELLRYHMKFRFWFQEYTPASESTAVSHLNLDRLYQQTEANAGEYDVPPAFAIKDVPIPGYPSWPLNKPTPGTTCTGTCPGGDDCECTHTIEYKWKVQADTTLIYAGGHCHAPSCLGIELTRNDTGELLCNQLPIYGKGDVVNDKYDEAGYVALPPCVWGEDGLVNAPTIPKGTYIRSVKRNRNTLVGHYGEMASWQMRGVCHDDNGAVIVCPAFAP